MAVDSAPARLLGRLAVALLLPAAGAGAGAGHGSLLPLLGPGDPLGSTMVLWPANVSAFFPTKGVPTTLAWTVAGAPQAAAAAPRTLRWAITGYSGSARDDPHPSGTLTWTPPALPSLTHTFSQGFFEVTFPDLGNQSFGVVSLPDFAARHPEGRDAAFSIDAALTQASGVGSTIRPNYPAYRQQLISSLGRLGLASVRERGCAGAAMAPNGSVSWAPLNTAVRSEWHRAGIGVVDLCFGEEKWMGREAGGKTVTNLSALALKMRRLASSFPARDSWDHQHSFIELWSKQVQSSIGVCLQSFRARRRLAEGAWCMLLLRRVR